MNAKPRKNNFNNDCSKQPLANQTTKGISKKVLQMNQNSVDHTELYEDKNAEILEKDAFDAKNKQKAPQKKRN